MVRCARGRVPPIRRSSAHGRGRRAHRARRNHRAAHREADRQASQARHLCLRLGRTGPLGRARPRAPPRSRARPLAHAQPRTHRGTRRRAARRAAGRAAASAARHAAGLEACANPRVHVRLGCPRGRRPTVRHRPAHRPPRRRRRGGRHLARAARRTRQGGRGVDRQSRGHRRTRRGGPCRSAPQSAGDPRRPARRRDRPRRETDSHHVHGDPVSPRRPSRMQDCGEHDARGRLRDAHAQLDLRRSPPSTARRRRGKPQLRAPCWPASPPPTPRAAKRSDGARAHRTTATPSRLSVTCRPAVPMLPSSSSGSSASRTRCNTASRTSRDKGS